MPEKYVDQVLVRQVLLWPRYWVADKGPVWLDSYQYLNNGAFSWRVGRWLVPEIREDGRKFVKIFNPGTKRVTVPVARLVALAWIGDPPINKPWALHKNSDASNDHYTNLYWGDKIDNAKDRVDIGNANLGPKAEKHYLSYLSPEQVVEIYKRVHLGESLTSLATEFHTTIHTVYDIKHQKTWASVTKEVSSQ